MGLEQLVQVQVCHRPRTISHEIMSSSSHSQAAGMNIDSDVYGSMLAAAFERLRVSERDVQGSTSQSSTGIMMNDTFAVLSSPQATPPDPRNVPVPDSGSEHGEGDKWPVQDEPEGEAAPYE
eukprot:12838-Amphidinium_carterae.1